MRTILIIDDQVEVRELVEVTLRIEDFTILQAQNGDEAIEVVKQQKPDLIIMDLMMPGEVDGLKATKILKSSPDTKDIKIIMLTAKGQQSDIDEGFKAGADAYFIKPFSPLELIQKVDEVLNA